METQTEKNSSDIKNLQSPSFRQDMFHPSRLLYAILGMILFIMVGQFVPDTYFKYFDRTVYFSVKQPVEVDKNVYAPGDQVTLTLVRTVVYPANVHGVIELILVDAEDSGITKRTLKTADFNIDTSNNMVVHVSYALPPDLADGSYYIKAVLNYQIKKVPKTYVWQTEAFSVEKIAPKE